MKLTSNKRSTASSLLQQLPLQVPWYSPMRLSRIVPHSVSNPAARSNGAIADSLVSVRDNWESQEEAEFNLNVYGNARLVDIEMKSLSTGNRDFMESIAALGNRNDYLPQRPFPWIHCNGCAQHRDSRSDVPDISPYDTDVDLRELGLQLPLVDPTAYWTPLDNRPARPAARQALLRIRAAGSDSGEGIRSRKRTAGSLEHDGDRAADEVGFRREWGEAGDEDKAFDKVNEKAQFVLMQVRSMEKFLGSDLVLIPIGIRSGVKWSRTRLLSASCRRSTIHMSSSGIVRHRRCTFHASTPRLLEVEPAVILHGYSRS
jgi:hypothetical protein